MHAGPFTLLVLAILLVGCRPGEPLPTVEQATQQVFAVERAFARTMADRDHAAFSGFLSQDAVFFGGSRPLKGKQAVAEGWRRYYEGTTPPFSWQPEEVEVLATGDLALSSGPVRSPEGKLVARYTSIWRREGPGVWRIVFDKGNDVCDCTGQ